MAERRLNPVDEIINILMSNIPGSGGEAHRQGMGVPPRLPPGTGQSGFIQTPEQSSRMAANQGRADDNAFKDMVGDFDVFQQGDMIGDFDIQQEPGKPPGEQEILDKYIGPDSDVDYAGFTGKGGQHRIRLTPRDTAPDAKYKDIDAGLTVPELSMDNPVFRQLLMKLVDEFEGGASKLGGME